MYVFFCLAWSIPVRCRTNRHCCNNRSYSCLWYAVVFLVFLSLLLSALSSLLSLLLFFGVCFFLKFYSDRFFCLFPFSFFRFLFSFSSRSLPITLVFSPPLSHLLLPLSPSPSRSQQPLRLCFHCGYGPQCRCRCCCSCYVLCVRLSSSHSSSATGLWCCSLFRTERTERR